MGRYIIRRVLWVIVVMIVVTFLAFLVFYVLPSSKPENSFVGKAPTPELIAQVRKDLGLNHPAIVQYGLFVKRLFLGDKYGWPGLGFSYNTKSPIRDELISRFWVTFGLALGAAIIWLFLGILIGTISALRRRSALDRGAMGFALLGVSTPVFFLGILWLFVFWKTLHWIPGTGYVHLTSDPVGYFTHMISPWIVLALLFAAIYARVVRGNMLDVLSEDYIRTARAKGLTERRVVIKHALRAALTPVVTLFGLDFGILFGGAVVTEKVFNLPGLGNYILDAAFQLDIPVALAVTTVTALVVAIMSLLVDIAYAYLDPRVTYS
jgi:peptide/nickel transport system permease protein